MTIDPGSVEFQVILGLTIAIITIKGLLATRLGFQVFKKHQQEQALTFDFVFAVFIFLIMAALSRVVYSIFDFSLTRFDISLYAEYIWWWKVAAIFYQVGIVILLYVVDQKILQGKFKGIPAYICLGVAILVVAYPVSTTADFTTISAFLIITGLVSLILPFMFLYVGWKTPSVRKNAWIIAGAILIYALGTVIVGDVVVRPLVVATGGNAIQVTLYILSTSFKTIGLIFLSYGTLQMKI